MTSTQREPRVDDDHFAGTVGNTVAESVPYWPTPAKAPWFQGRWLVSPSPNLSTGS